VHFCLRPILPRSRHLCSCVCGMPWLLYTGFELVRWVVAHVTDLSPLLCLFSLFFSETFVAGFLLRRWRRPNPPLLSSFSIRANPNFCRRGPAQLKVLRRSFWVLPRCFSSPLSSRSDPLASCPEVRYFPIFVSFSLEIFFEICLLFCPSPVWLLSFFWVIQSFTLLFSYVLFPSRRLNITSALLLFFLSWFSESPPGIKFPLDCFPRGYSCHRLGSFPRLFFAF